MIYDPRRPIAPQVYGMVAAPPGGDDWQRAIGQAVAELASRVDALDDRINRLVDCLVREANRITDLEE